MVNRHKSVCIFMAFVIIILSLAIYCVYRIYKPIYFEGAPGEIKISKQDDFTCNIYLKSSVSFHANSDEIPLSYKILMYRTLEGLEAIDNVPNESRNINADSYINIDFGGQIMGITVNSYDEKYIGICCRWGSKSTIGYTQYQNEVFYIIDSNRYDKLVNRYCKLVEKLHPERYGSESSR